MNLDKTCIFICKNPTDNNVSSIEYITISCMHVCAVCVYVCVCVCMYVGMYVTVERPSGYSDKCNSNSYS